MATVETTPPATRETPQAGDWFSGLTFEVPVDACTLDGFLRWEDSQSYPQRGRIDFLSGRLFIDMAAGEIHSHETLKSRLGSPDIQNTSEIKAASQTKPVKLMAFFS